MLKPHERYIFKPNIGSSHFWAIENLKSLSKDASVLDIGAGSGAMAEVLKEQGLTELFAVEIDKDTREHIAPLYRSVFAALDQVKLSEKVDAVLLLDVLEHTADPESFLKESASHIKSGGMALISVPNIANWSIRLLLLFGFFEYTTRGILDRTHLHFFTKRTLLRMIKDSGQFTIDSTAVSIVPLELLVPKVVSDSKLYKMLAKLRYTLSQFVPGLFGYQLLVKAIKK